MKSIYVVRSANENTDSVEYLFDEASAIKMANRMYDDLTDKEKTANTVTVEQYDLPVDDHDNRTADQLARDMYDLDDVPFCHGAVRVIDISKTKVNVFKRFRDKIEEEMVKRYSDVVWSDGKIQYKVYIWDDGTIECLEGAQGDNSYLKPRDYESRALYYVTTIEMPCFDPWDYWCTSVPDDEEEKNEALKSILEYLVDEYESNVVDAMDGIIFEAEQEESFLA